MIFVAGADRGASLTQIHPTYERVTMLYRVPTERFPSTNARKLSKGTTVERPILIVSISPLPIKV
jgi:hypothetical protein